MTRDTFGALIPLERYAPRCVADPRSAGPKPVLDLANGHSCCELRLLGPYPTRDGMKFLSF